MDQKDLANLRKRNTVKIQPTVRAEPVVRQEKFIGKFGSVEAGPNISHRRVPPPKGRFKDYVDNLERHQASDVANFIEKNPDFKFED